MAAINVNLLPKELSTSGAPAKVSAFLKRFSIIALTIFIIASVAAGAYLIILSFEIRSSQQNIESLQQEILNLEGAETQLILAKDRVKKAQTVLALDTTAESVTKIESIASSLPSGVTLVNLDAEPTRVEATISSQNSKSLTPYLSTLSASEEFAQILMTSFAFNPATGYSLSFEFHMQ